MNVSGFLTQVSIIAIPLLFAITLHEVAHGLVARLYGDRTAEAQGRLSLNPLKHVDPIGTLLLPALQLLFMGRIFFGWAKPVPVDARRLRNPRWDMLKVAAAGPLANLLMAIFWVLVMIATRRFALPGDGQPWVTAMAEAGFYINILLAAFNLLPILPLDGGRVLANLLPAGSLRHGLERLEPYGLIIIMLLLLTRVLDVVLWPIMAALTFVVATVTGQG
jgi:Zn-dependent protease